MKTNGGRQLLMSLMIFIVVGLIPNLALAQVTDPGCPDCPIDGGLSLLLAAGVGYGVKKYREEKKRVINNE